MRISRTEVISAITIGAAAIALYSYVAGVLHGRGANVTWASFMNGEASLRHVLPPELVAVVFFGLLFAYLTRHISYDLMLWKLAVRLRIPNSLALSPITRFIERILTSNYQLQRRALKHLPDDTKVLLDVGCGGATYLDNINAYKIGVDVNPKRLLVARDHCIAIERDIVKRGISDLEADAVVCFEVIEHLSDKEGTKLLKELENYPFVVLSTPREFFNVNRDGAERHKSFWSTERLKSFGYKLVEEIIVPPSNIYVRKR